MIAHSSLGVNEIREEFFDGTKQTVQSSHLRPLQLRGAA